MEVKNKTKDISETYAVASGVGAVCLTLLVLGDLQGQMACSFGRS